MKNYLFAVNVFEILQVILYAALLAYLILRLRFFRKFFVDARLIAAVFLLKVLMGVVYALVYRFYYGGGDTFEYFESSKILTRLFIEQDYKAFLKLTFGYNSRPPDADIKEYAFALSYWNDMSAYFLIRFHAIASVLSFSNYFVHIVFYNWLVMIGMLYLFRFFYEQLMCKKPLVFGVVFLVPSILFWSSGIHKDGLSLAALGLILFSCSKLFLFSDNRSESGKSTALSIQEKLQLFFLFAIGCWLLIILRNYWMMLLVPSLASWILTRTMVRLKWLTFLGVHAVYYGVTTHLSGILPQWDFLNLLVQKQNEFVAIVHQSGVSSLPVHPVSASLLSVLQAVPLAIYNCLLQPGITGLEGILQFLAFLENAAVILSLLIAMVFIQKRFTHSEQSLMLLCLFFTFSLFVVLGITVPILGALSRYKIAGVMMLLMIAVILVNHLAIFVKLMPPFPKEKKSDGL